MRRVAFVLTSVFLLVVLAAPAAAITFCYDYVIYKVSCQNSNGAGADGVRAALKANGYGSKPFASVPDATMLAGFPVKPGDVFIFSGHVAIVNQHGTFNHYLQAPGKVGVEHTPKELKSLPNMYIGWSLDQFINFRRTNAAGEEFFPFKHAPAEVWRSNLGPRKCPGEEGGGDQSCVLYVDNTKPARVRTRFDTEVGAAYRIEAKGTISDWSDKDEGVDPVWCYAEWRCGPGGQPWQQLRINGKGMMDLAGKTIPYNSKHYYQIIVYGTGAPFEFWCSDAQDSSGDNKKGFDVRVTKVQQGDVTSPSPIG
jgi:hypothetical protein